MRKLETIRKNVVKELNLSSVEEYGTTDVDAFINDAKRYKKAIKEGRAICFIDSVSKSGMSRTIKFLECNKGRTQYNYMTFFFLFSSLGFSSVKNSDYFRVYGCGMDMVFHTNYTICHNLQRLGIMSKKECEILSQKTPTTI